MIPEHSGQVDNILSCQSCAKLCPHAQLRLNINYCAEMFSYSDAKLRSTTVRKDESLSLNCKAWLVAEGKCEVAAEEEMGVQAHSCPRTGNVTLV